jgi:hypothetical protein
MEWVCYMCKHEGELVDHLFASFVWYDCNFWNVQEGELGRRKCRVASGQGPLWFTWCIWMIVKVTLLRVFYFF